MARDDQRSAAIAAAIGASGLLVWLLLRDKGQGHGPGDSGHGWHPSPGQSRERVVAPPSPIAPMLPTPPMTPLPMAPPAPQAKPEIAVMIRSEDRIDLNGKPSDLAHVAIAAATAGLVVVRATGDARHGFIANVLAALVSSGIRVSAGADLGSDLGQARRDWATAEATRGASAPM